MPSLLGKSSKEVKRQWSLESIIGSLRMKCIRPGSPQRKQSDFTYDRDSQSAVDSRSPSSSKTVSRHQSFGKRSQSQPLPLPGSLSTILFRADSGTSASAELSIDRGSKTSTCQSLPNPGHVKVGLHVVVGEGDLVSASNSGDSSPDTDDPSDSRLLSPHTFDYEIGTKSETSPSGLKQMEQAPFAIKTISRDMLSPANILSTYKAKPASLNQRPGSSKVPHLQNPCQGTLLSSSQSSMLSHSRSPMRVFGHETATNSVFMLRKPHVDSSLLGSGHCSSPGSGYNSGHNSITGDMQCQYLWPHSRCSPDCSPLPSPRMTSPGPSSQVHSGAVTPLHPHAGVPSAESHITWPDDARKQSHRMPLPPLTITTTAFSPSYSAGTSPRVQRCPVRTENPPSPGSRWKKGRLLGRGTFGHVYLGFDSESGEMCAMKEVTLFSDDAKSKESAQQLEQEIVFLSQLRHHNIVQYYGSEMVDDKLYIYLEYVSGGSINKILQEYGQLGEAAIRSYTQQILSGVAYLHAQNTVHRDIKGANILVDPNGRVKLADFGMAEHINGQSAPLTFKGSPYWMAPEAIKNSGGSKLAVDIWSLGCTVIEMATTKPPWSQYEWVAAMFKIGNGKELPAIPDLLSEEGKDFVRQCLQRNPHNRPTAAQLLEHPFVKNSASLERPILSAEPIESIDGVTHSVREMGFGQSRISSCFDSSAAPVRCKCPKSSTTSSDGYVAGNISPPISPMWSSLSHSRSPRSGRLTPSPISSPRTTSGASTPRNGVSTGTTYSLYHPITNYLHEGIPNSHKTLYQDGYGYQEQKPDIFRGIVQAHLSSQPVSRESAVIRNKAEQTFSRGKRGQLYEAHLVLADRVSQQLLTNPVRPKPRLEPNGTSPRPTRRNGI